MTAATATARRMPLSVHLREARKRSLRAAAALAVAAVIAYLCSDQVLDVLRAPVLDIAESRAAAINYDSITGAFDLKLRIALLGGIALSSPVWLYQLFAYIGPALSRREKRWTFGFLAAVLPLFAAGCAMGVLLFPRMIELLTGFAPAEDTTLLQASYYFDFVLKLVLAAGVAFTLPVLVVLLNFMGVLPASGIARSWRVCVVAISVFSALVTPAADLLSMFAIAVPMAALFAAALLVSWLHDRRVSRRAAADLVAELGSGASDAPEVSEAPERGRAARGAAADGGIGRAGAAPAGTGPDGTGPAETVPGGIGSAGLASDGIAPGGTAPAGTASGGTGPAGIAPDATAPDGVRASDVRSKEGVAENARSDL